MALPIALTLPHQPADSLRRLRQERHCFAQHHEKQLSHAEAFIAVDHVQPRHRRSLVPGVSLDRDRTVPSEHVLVSLAFEKTKSSGCAEDASFAGRGEQTL
jgi:hypothetical protein